MSDTYGIRTGPEIPEPSDLVAERVKEIQGVMLDLARGLGVSHQPIPEVVTVVFDHLIARIARLELAAGLDP